MSSRKNEVCFGKSFEYGERGLISAILIRAFNDALGKSTPTDKASALRFINKDNELFCFYCEILSLDPEYVVRKFRNHLDKRKSKVLKPIKEGSEINMECIHCNYPHSSVVDTRHDKSIIKRRRECLKCGFRFSTREDYKDAPRKRDDRFLAKNVR